MEGKETTVAVIETPDVTEQEKTLSKQVTEIEFQASAITIKSEEDYQNAAGFGRMLKQRTSDVKEFWKPMKDAAHKAHAEICSKEKAMLQPLTNAEKILKNTMGAYVAEQDRKRREAEEAARRAAQEEVDRKMQEAIDLDAAGDAAGAEMAMMEAEVMDDMSESVAVAGVKPKADGASASKDWEIVDIDTNLVPTSVAGVEIRPVDRAAVMRLIRASKGSIKIEGVTYKEVVKIALRK